MSTTHYFEKFKQFTYNKTNAIDLVTSGKLVERFVNSPYVYYPYTLNYAERAEVLAHQYYDDSYYVWLIYYANKVVDPYYDWYQSNEVFLSSIVAKYGSVEYAQKKVAFYRTNWYSDERQLSTSTFLTLPAQEQKYWEKKFNEEVGVLLYYYRKPQDITVNTNQIVTLEVTSVGSFSVGDLVDVRRNSADVGTAEVLSFSVDRLILKNIYLTDGIIVPGDTIRHDSNTSITASVVSTIGTFKNIPDAEMAYWEAVTYFEYENEKNSEKQTVKLIDNRIALPVSEALTDAMRE